MDALVHAPTFLEEYLVADMDYRAFVRLGILAKSDKPEKPKNSKFMYHTKSLLAQTHKDLDLSSLFQE